jgi:hypothetical protein
MESLGLLLRKTDPRYVHLLEMCVLDELVRLLLRGGEDHATPLEAAVDLHDISESCSALRVWTADRKMLYTARLEDSRDMG